MWRISAIFWAVSACAHAPAQCINCTPTAVFATDSQLRIDSEWSSGCHASQGWQWGGGEGAHDVDCDDVARPPPLPAGAENSPSIRSALRHRVR
jgi:hypothetical protein